MSEDLGALKEKIAQFENNEERLKQRIHKLEIAVEALLNHDSKFLNKLPVFNDQEERKKIFLSLVSKVAFTLAVETGTSLAATTQFLAKTFKDIPVYTSEIEQASFCIARERLKSFNHVTILNVDSRDLIRKIAGEAGDIDSLPFFYLDAHWYNDLPLREEVSIISDAWRSFVIMIDDFQVPTDNGYGWDDYGEDKTLSLDYLAPVFSIHQDIGVFFPAISSEKETGARRGAVVLCRGDDVLDIVKRDPTLFEYFIK